MKEDKKLTKDGNLPSYPKNEIDNKFKDVYYFFAGIIIILIVMVATLVIDSFHFNSATYKEYSNKIESVDNILKTNQELLNQNQNNQQIILEQQKEIKALLED